MSRFSFKFDTRISTRVEYADATPVPVSSLVPAAMLRDNLLKVLNSWIEPRQAVWLEEYPPPPPKRSDADDDDFERQLEEDTFIGQVIEQMEDPGREASQADIQKAVEMIASRLTGSNQPSLSRFHMRQLDPDEKYYTNEEMLERGRDNDQEAYQNRLLREMQANTKAREQFTKRLEKKVGNIAHSFLEPDNWGINFMRRAALLERLLDHEDPVPGMVESLQDRRELAGMLDESQARQKLIRRLRKAELRSADEMIARLEGAAPTLTDKESKEMILSRWTEASQNLALPEDDRRRLRNSIAGFDARIRRMGIEKAIRRGILSISVLEGRFPSENIANPAQREALRKLRTAQVTARHPDVAARIKEHVEALERRSESVEAATHIGSAYADLSRWGLLGSEGEAEAPASAPAPAPAPTSEPDGPEIDPMLKKQLLHLHDSARRINRNVRRREERDRITRAAESLKRHLRQGTVSVANVNVWLQQHDQPLLPRAEVSREEAQRQVSRDVEASKIAFEEWVQENPVKGILEAGFIQGSQVQADNTVREFEQIEGLDVVTNNERTAQAVMDTVRISTQKIAYVGAAYHDQMASILYNGYVKGQTKETMAKLMQGRNSVLNSRAEFIARNEMGNMYAKLTEIRQTDNGVTKYTWRTAEDERVRASHGAKNGLVFSWDDPPPDTGNPGADYNCRCYAEPLLEQLDPEMSEEPPAPIVNPAELEPKKPQKPVMPGATGIGAYEAVFENPGRQDDEKTFEDWNIHFTRVGDIDEAGENFREMFGQEFTAKNVYTVMGLTGIPTRSINIENQYGGGIYFRASGDWFDPNDKNKGKGFDSLNRKFAIDSNGELQVYHALFEVGVHNRGKGLGTVINHGALKAYEQLGIDRIHLTAAWVGSYNWPSQGYELSGKPGQRLDQFQRKYYEWITKQVAKNPHWFEGSPIERLMDGNATDEGEAAMEWLSDFAYSAKSIHELSQSRIPGATFKVPDFPVRNQMGTVKKAGKAFLLAYGRNEVDGEMIGLDIRMHDDARRSSAIESDRPPNVDMFREILDKKLSRLPKGRISEEMADRWLRRTWLPEGVAPEVSPERTQAFLTKAQGLLSGSSSEHESERGVIAQYLRNLGIAQGVSMAEALEAQGEKIEETRRLRAEEEIRVREINRATEPIETDAMFGSALAGANEFVSLPDGSKQIVVSDDAEPSATHVDGMQITVNSLNVVDGRVNTRVTAGDHRVGQDFRGDYAPPGQDVYTFEFRLSETGLRLPRLMQQAEGTLNARLRHNWLQGAIAEWQSRLTTTDSKAVARIGDWDFQEIEPPSQRELALGEGSVSRLETRPVNVEDRPLSNYEEAAPSFGETLHFDLPPIDGRSPIPGHTGLQRMASRVAINLGGLADRPGALRGTVRITVPTVSIDPDDIPTYSITGVDGAQGPDYNRMPNAVITAYERDPSTAPPFFDEERGHWRYSDQNIPPRLLMTPEEQARVTYEAIAGSMRLGASNMTSSPSIDTQREQVRSRIIEQWSPVIHAELWDSGLTSDLRRRKSTEQSLERVQQGFEAWSHDNPTINEVDGLAETLSEIAADAEQREVFPGYETTYSQTQADWLTESGVTALYRDVPADQLGRIVYSGGLASATSRLERGQFSKGTVSGRDFENGTARSVAVHPAATDNLVHLMPSGSETNIRLVIDPSELGRQDWYATYYDDDHGASQSGSFAGRMDMPTVANMATVDNPSGIERVVGARQSGMGFTPQTTMQFENGISLAHVQYAAVTSEDEQKAVVESLVAQGINEINGQPVDEFVRVLGRTKSEQVEIPTAPVETEEVNEDPTVREMLEEAREAPERDTSALYAMLTGRSAPEAVAEGVPSVAMGDTMLYRSSGNRLVPIKVMSDPVDGRVLIARVGLGGDVVTTPGQELTRSLADLVPYDDDEPATEAPAIRTFDVSASRVEAGNYIVSVNGGEVGDLIKQGSEWIFTPKSGTGGGTVSGSTKREVMNQLRGRDWS